MTFAKQIIDFNNQLTFEHELPKNWQIMNPFDQEITRDVSETFYRSFYDDDHQRRLILGINPGRLGAGYTGIPFTDPKRVKQLFGIDLPEKHHEPSSEFVYMVIDAFGGPKEFFERFYISSVCPLGFTTISEKGRTVNRNYYDHTDLLKTMEGYALEQLKKQINFGLKTDVLFVLGTSKNFEFVKELNDNHHLFDQVEPLAHPRFVMQYRRKMVSEYVDEFVSKLSSVV